MRQLFRRRHRPVVSIANIRFERPTIAPVSKSQIFALIVIGGLGLLMIVFGLTGCIGPDRVEINVSRCQ